MFYLKAPRTISSNAIFTEPKDEDYCKEYTKIKTFFYVILDLLTNGCSVYDFEINKLITLTVLNFFKGTNRFD